MKKLLSLIGALLLWQSVAVAQNYLHITSGDSTKIVRMAELDSVTVRDAEFYAQSIYAKARILIHSLQECHKQFPYTCKATNI